MRKSLRCTGYVVTREPDSPVRISADFILIDVNRLDTESIALALANIERYLAGEIDFVKAAPTDKVRCFYCGVLNDTDTKLCTQCGASL